MLAGIDAKAKEQQAEMEYENAVLEYSTRTMPLGTDRNYNMYWMFAQCPGKLFVQFSNPALIHLKTHESKREALCQQLEISRKYPAQSSQGMQSADADALRTSLKDYLLSEEDDSECNLAVKCLGTFVQDPALAVLFHSRPCRSYQAKWGVYVTKQQLWSVYESLDSRGEREAALKQQVKTRFGLEEPPVVYQTEGSEFLGRQVKRKFKDSNTKKVCIFSFHAMNQ